MKSHILRVLLLSPVFSLLAMAQSLEGVWQGNVTMPNAAESRAAIRVTRADGSLAGVMFLLDINLQLPVANISLQGATAKMSIAGMTYEGTLSADGNSLAGKLTMGGNTMPMPLKRATPETAWELPKPPAILAKDVPLEFVVATIKPAPVTNIPSGTYGIGPGSYQAHGASLIYLLTFGYNMHPKQFAGLPAWATSDRYEVNAKLPEGGRPTDAQLRIMVQNLVKDRFGITLHIEKRELSAYTINVGKGGLAGIKMTRSESQASNGAGTFAGSVPGTGLMTMNNATMTDMASLMQRVMLDRPVVDQSGLTGRYNVALKWAPDETQFTQMNLMLAPPPGADPLPDLVTAFQEQLGMKLESTKAPVDVIVIDKVSRPSEN
ncbi:MAG TPA: TIGR03435 family protein [Terriglobia bacterium]